METLRLQLLTGDLIVHDRTIVREKPAVPEKNLRR
jgi:hypothetical protein